VKGRKEKRRKGGDVPVRRRETREVLAGEERRAAECNMVWGA
jgi:hypothetical protein